jgi:PAS domain-containing protein
MEPGTSNIALMSGVEVLANSINTILRGRFYAATPDWVALLTAFIIALLVAFTFSIGYSRHESLKQVLCLTALCALLLSLAYFVFMRWIIVPPVVPALVSFAAAAPLALARHAVIASAGLDERIRDLVRAEASLWPSIGADEKSHRLVTIWSHFPRGLEWKSRTLGMLNRLLARAHFFDRAMRSVEDGLIVSGLDGRIVFVNRRALEIFGTTERALLGSSLLERLHERGDAEENSRAAHPRADHH